MTTEWIIKDADFGRIKDVYIDGDTIKQFIVDVVYKHPNWNILLQNLSDIYVLVASFGSQTYLKNGEKSWKEIMNNEQYDMLKKNSTLVIGYMLVKEKYENIHYIDLFDTVVRNNNLGFHMINKYEKERDYNVKLIPQEIIQTSAKYWAKMLHVMDDVGIVQKSLIDEFIEDTNINSKDISWEYLYELCGEDENEDENENEDEDDEE